MSRRILSFILAVLMMLTLLPAAQAANSGDSCPNCGSGRVWHEREEPWCTEPGMVETGCDVCNYRSRTTIPALGHSYGQWWLDQDLPNCTKTTTARRWCIRCQHEDTTTIRGDHSFSWTVYPATCTEPGKRVGVCDYCGHTWEGENEPANGHKMGPWYVVYPATRGVSGKLERVCSVCGYTEEDEYDAEFSRVWLTKRADDYTTHYEGDTIEFSVTIENRGPNPLYDVEVYDPLKGENEDAILDIIPELKPGESSTSSFIYTVTTDDAERRYVENVAFARWTETHVMPAPDKEGNTTASITIDDYTDEVTVPVGGGSFIIVQKVLNDTPDNGEYFVEDEEVEYVLHITNNTDSDARIISIADMIRIGDVYGTDYAIDCDLTVHPGETVDHHFSILICDFEVEQGFAEDYAFVIWTDESGGDFYSESNHVTVPLPTIEEEPFVIHKYLECEPMNGEYFVEGEIVVFGVDIINNTDMPVAVQELLDCIIERDWTFVFDENFIVLPHSVEHSWVNYTVTKEDAERGYVTDEVHAETDGAWLAQSNAVTITCGVGEPVYVVKIETSAPANGDYYTEGETATFEIWVKNISTDTVIIVEKVTEVIVEKDEWITLYDGDSDITVQPGDVAVFKCEYPVETGDARLGYAEDYALVQWTNVAEDTEHETHSNNVVIKCDRDQEFFVTKELLYMPENGVFFTEGEEVLFDVTVTNTAFSAVTGVVIHDIVVEYGMDNVITEPMDIEAQETLEFTIGYVITDEDVARGYVTDYILLTDENGETLGKSYELIVYCDEKLPEISVNKSVVSVPANGEYYVKGETVTFAVVVENLTNYDLYDIDIWDSVEDNDGVYEITIMYLPAHDAELVTFDYIVTADDVDRGSVSDQACAIWEFRTVGKIEWSNICTVKTGGETGSVTVIKEVISSPINGMYYTEGEYVTYMVTVTNETSSEITDVNVYDDYLGCMDYAVSVPAGESIAFVFGYIVTDYDCEAGYLYNQASARFIINENEKTIYSNPVTVPTGKDPEPAKVEAEILKQVISMPANGEFYVPGEKIFYMVSVTNTGDVPFNEVDMYDVMFVFGYTLNLDYAHTATVAPGDTVSYVFEYTVTVEDTALEYLYDNAYAQIFTDDEVITKYTRDCVVRVGIGDIFEHHDAEIYKYVTSTPANGKYYVEGEKIVYALIAINNDDTITAIDDILMGLPGCVMYQDMFLSAITGYSCWIVEYTVDITDVIMEEVSNIAWITAETSRGYTYMSYSEEVKVPCGKEGGVSHHGNSCIKTLVSASDTAELIRTDLCDTHAALEAAAQNCATAAERVSMWERAVYTMYSALITSTGDMSLETDRACFMNYIASLKNVLDDEVIAEILRERTTELCYEMSGLGRKDLRTASTPVLAEHIEDMNECAYIVDSFGGCYTAEAITAGAHKMTATGVSRLLTILETDASLTESVWARVTGLWQNALTAQIDGEILVTPAAITLKALTPAQIFSRTAALTAVYPDDPALVNELIAREIKTALIQLCGK